MLYCYNAFFTFINNNLNAIMLTSDNPYTRSVITYQYTLYYFDIP
jgi:hypothetical protein